MLYGALEIVAAFEVKNLPTTFDVLTGQTDAEPARHFDPIGAKG